MTAPVPRPLGATVRGAPAFVFATVLDGGLPKALAELEASRADPATLAKVREAWADMREAARQWQAWRLACVDASAQAVVAQADTDSTQDVISTVTAAGHLGVTPARVRQMLADGQLSGEKVGRTWVVSRTSVLVARQMRMVA